MRTLREMALKQKDLSAVLDAADSLRARFPVERIVIFGSKVRGKDDDISDIDILVLTSRTVAWQEKSRIVRLLSAIGHQYDVLFDPVIHSLEEWNNGIPRYFPIHQEVEDEGVLVA